MNQNAKALIEVLSSLPNDIFIKATVSLSNLVRLTMPKYVPGESKEAYSTLLVAYIQHATLQPLREERKRLMFELSKDSNTNDEKSRIYFQVLTIDLLIGAQANNPKPQSKPDEK